MKILYVSSEITPFAKTGGLADVAQALPKALKALGHDIRTVMPKYLSIAEQNLAMERVRRSPSKCITAFTAPCYGRLKMIPCPPILLRTTRTSIARGFTAWATGTIRTTWSGLCFFARRPWSAAKPSICSRCDPLQRLADSRPAGDAQGHLCGLPQGSFF
jgi:hypothetical protein